MVINSWKALLFLAGGTAAAGATAYVSGALDPYLHTRSEQAVNKPGQDAPAQAARLSAPEQPAAPGKPEEQIPAAEKSVVPAFDVVRVEPDGSVVVAGKVEPGASVEMLAGEQVIGTAKADGSGHFAIVLDEPLKPGDYQLTLRSSTAGGPVVASAETAVVSVPKNPDGQVLALVETPGKPSQVVTAPRPETKATAEGGARPEASKLEEPGRRGQSAQVSSEQPPQQQAAAGAAGSSAPTQPVQGHASEDGHAPAVSVQAVEIERTKIFIAGTAEPGRTVRIYADDMLLGEAKAAPNGRFLVEAERELPVGNYTIRADVLSDDGLRVIARAAVPFEREPGESIAALAPTRAPQAQGADAGSKAVQPAQQTPSAASAAATPSEQADNPQAATAPKLQSVASSVIIRRGDTLWRISRRVYGRGIRYSTIYLANQDQITNPNLIWPGQVFSVPGRTKEGEAADMKAMGDQMTANRAPAPQ